MKIKNIYFALIALILALSSCSEALDMAPDGKLTMDDIFADNDKVGAFLNSCYSNMPVKGTRYFFWSRGPVVWSDEAWDTDAEAESWIMAGRMYNGDASAGSHPEFTMEFSAFKQVPKLVNDELIKKYQSEKKNA